MDLYAMGLVHRETGTPWDCYIKRLTHNAHAQYTEGLLHRESDTKWDWYTENLVHVAYA